MHRAGFVLTGGSSRRMGRDKARLARGPRLLVEDIAETVKIVAGTVALVGAADRYGDLAFERLDDAQPGCGPLGGIASALASRRGDLNLIVACDMPDLTPPLLERLFAEAESGSTRCLVCRDEEGTVHPLCGVWRTADCYGEVLQALAERRLRVTDLLDRLGARFLAVEAKLTNVNTPDEWRRALAG